MLVLGTKNPYLFATGTGGEGHAQGSKDIDHVVRSIYGFQKPELLTATKIRHKKSSDFAEIEGMTYSRTDRVSRSREAGRGLDETVNQFVLLTLILR